MKSMDNSREELNGNNGPALEADGVGGGCVSEGSFFVASLCNQL